MSDLVCPKCQSPMRSYERNEVTVDQCTECRGIFLDRGELERLVDAEGSFYEQRGVQQREPDRRDHEHGRDHEHRKPYKKKRKESFLSDLLEF